MSLLNSLRAGMNPYPQSLAEVQGLRALMQKNAEEALNTGQAAQAQSALAEQSSPAGQSVSAAAQSGSSLMSGNFAGRGRSSGSVYVQATLDSFKQDNALQSSRNQSAFALVLEAQGQYADANGDGEMSYAELYLGARKSERMILRKQRAKEQEAGEEALEKIRSEREKTSREVTAPRDADGNPILVGPEALEAEEIPAPEPAPAPAAEATLAEAAPLPEQVQYSPPVPLTGGSIDIKI